MTRVGANSLFRFYAGGRDMTLDGGTMLFYSPKGAGGGKVQAGAVTAAVTGSAVMVMNLSPTIKVVCLEHAAVVSGPGFTRRIRQGQVIDQNGKVTNINIAALARSSNLCSGFSTPLPFVLRDYQKTQINLDTNVDQTGQVARRTILGNQQGPVATTAQPGQPPATGSQPAVLSPSGPQPPPGPPGPPPNHHKHLCKVLHKVAHKLAHRPPPGQTATGQTATGQTASHRGRREWPIGRARSEPVDLTVEI